MQPSPADIFKPGLALGGGLDPGGQLVDRGAEVAAAAHVDVGLVDRHLLDPGREAAQAGEELLGDAAVEVEAAAAENGLRAFLGRGAQGHARVHPEAPRRVGGGADHAPLVGQAADDQRLAAQRRLERLLHRREKGVDVQVQDGRRFHRYLRKTPTTLPTSWKGAVMGA